MNRADLLTAVICANAIGLRAVKVLVNENLMSDPTGHLNKAEVLGHMDVIIKGHIKILRALTEIGGCSIDDLIKETIDTVEEP